EFYKYVCNIFLFDFIIENGLQGLFCVGLKNLRVITCYGRRHDNIIRDNVFLAYNIPCMFLKQAFEANISQALVCIFLLTYRLFTLFFSFLFKDIIYNFFIEYPNAHVCENRPKYIWL
ncbi:hypothetical protein ACJX0J_022547, partial [Zea mays]